METVLFVTSKTILECMCRSSAVVRLVVSGEFEFESINKQPMKAGQGLKSSLARKD